MPDKLFLMPLDWDALLTDEKVIAMTDPSFRAYLHLLRAAWQSDNPASLPDNDSFLARVSGVGLETWKQLRPELAACFRVSNGRWHQKKMRQVYDEVVRRRKCQQERTKAASEARWAVRDGVRNGEPTDHVTTHQLKTELKVNGNTHTPDQASPSSPPPAIDTLADDGPFRPLNEPLPPPANPAVPFVEIMGLYNDMCPSMPRAQLTDSRRKSIRTRWLECKRNGDVPLTWFANLFGKAEASDFLSGRSARDGSSWRCTFDWLIGPKNAPKVIEGNYDNQQRRAPVSTRPDIYVEPQNWREKAAAKWPGVPLPETWGELSATARNDLLNAR